MQHRPLMMSNAQIREDLVRRRRDVLARYDGTAMRVEEELDSREIEVVERAAEDWDARVLSLLGTADLQELGRLTAAIHKIDDGSYGDCDDCGDPIERARLEALPTTTKCFACAFEHENMHRVAR